MQEIFESKSNNFLHYPFDLSILHRMEKGRKKSNLILNCLYNYILYFDTLMYKILHVHCDAIGSDAIGSDFK